MSCRASPLAKRHKDGNRSVGTPESGKTECPGRLGNEWVRRMPATTAPRCWPARIAKSHTCRTAIISVELPKKPQLPRGADARLLGSSGVPGVPGVPSVPSSAQSSGVPPLLQGELGVLGVPGSRSGESAHSLLDLFLATSISYIISVNRGSTSFDHRKDRMRGCRSLLRARRRGWSSLLRARIMRGGCRSSFMTSLLARRLRFGLRASSLARIALSRRLLTNGSF